MFWPTVYLHFCNTLCLCLFMPMQGRVHRGAQGARVPTLALKVQCVHLNTTQLTQSQHA